MQDLEEKIRKILDIFLEEMNLELLEFKLFRYGLRYVLRCIVDFKEGGVTLNDCAELNKKLFNFIDKENILGEDFVVEVNSPGLDRKLKTAGDFLRVKNRRVGIFLNEEIAKKLYLEGEVIDIRDNLIFLRIKEDILKIDLNKIKFGKEKI